MVGLTTVASSYGPVFTGSPDKRHFCAWQGRKILRFVGLDLHTLQKGPEVAQVRFSEDALLLQSLAGRFRMQLSHYQYRQAKLTRRTYPI